MKTSIVNRRHSFFVQRIKHRFKVIIKHSKNIHTHAVLITHTKTAMI